MSAPLRITLVDDSDLAVAGLTSLLAPYAERVELVDTRAALAAPGGLDVILYEPLGLSGMAGALLRDLQASSEARAAVFSWAGPDQLPAAPANPHLVKSLTASQIVVSLERLVEGRFESAPVSARVVESAVAIMTPRAAETTEDDERPDAVEEFGLTPREAEILSLIVSGLSNREIGETLELSINSVKTYIRGAYRKIGVERRTQAVLWGLEHGIDAHRRGDPAMLVG